MSRIDSFTFHYVSINMYYKRNQSSRLFSLHSTMYLLISKRARDQEVGYTFTFHYVSINIHFRNSIYSLRYYTLHSTMYLLILAVL